MQINCVHVPAGYQPIIGQSDALITLVERMLLSLMLPAVKGKALDVRIPPLRRQVYPLKVPMVRKQQVGCFVCTTYASVYAKASATRDE